jgi:hypothetical protein
MPKYAYRMSYLFRCATYIEMFFYKINKIKLINKLIKLLRNIQNIFCSPGHVELGLWYEIIPNLVAICLSILVSLSIRKCLQ